VEKAIKHTVKEKLPLINVVTFVLDDQQFVLELIKKAFDEFGIDDYLMYTNADDFLTHFDKHVNIIDAMEAGCRHWVKKENNYAAKVAACVKKGTEKIYHDFKRYAQLLHKQQNLTDIKNKLREL
jgi:hypothetical protein